MQQKMQFVIFPLLLFHIFTLFRVLKEASLLRSLSCWTANSAYDWRSSDKFMSSIESRVCVCLCDFCRKYSSYALIWFCAILVIASPNRIKSKIYLRRNCSVITSVIDLTKCAGHSSECPSMYLRLVHSRICHKAWRGVYMSLTKSDRACCLNCRWHMQDHYTMIYDLAWRHNYPKTQICAPREVGEVIQMCLP